SIQAMGNKAQARQFMQEAGVPIVPGYQGQDDEQSLKHQADQIGYPVLIKAAAGGGGKGMRVVWNQDDLNDSIAAARRESLNAFGDERLILERYIPHAHHVEFQILGDSEGNLIHLFERECSVQRRYQKIIEETPSPLLDEELRTRMGTAAVTAARAAGYQNAGTVEFIVDPETHDFFFLEMNTRLQVEHPITEAVTGLDLVQWQIRIAAGEKLSFRQDQIAQRGHAIECRLYAEDPSNGFLPAAGRLMQFHQPKGPGVRMDTGFTSGDEIELFYDPLIAKLIVSAENRPAAIRKMQAALKETVILGMPSNWQFLRDVLADPEFETGHIYTTWVEEHFRQWQATNCVLPPEVLIAAALAQTQPVQAGEAASGNYRTGSGKDPYSPWASPGGFRLGE
ncbi:MAG: acetyl/propionyl/methylcrotonyl-CoA carboxylase subunit alpha, partial [Omnitrophica WOR_2 bacterium]